MTCRAVEDLLPLPSAPSSLAVTLLAASVVLTWDANPVSEGVTSYKIYRATNEGGPYALQNTVTIPTYTDATGSAGTVYYYHVSAVNSSGEGPYATISTTFPGDVTAPADPTGLTLTQNGPTSVLLDWTDNTETDLQGYNIYAATAAIGPFTKLNTTVTWPVSTYQHNSATAGNTWYYRVSALDTAGNESGFATGNLFIATPDIIAPAVPATPVASDTGSDIQVDWASNSETDLAGYNIYRSDDGYAAALNGVTLLTNSIYNDATAVIGTPYTYKVNAKDTTGNLSAKSLASNSITRSTSIVQDLTPFIKCGVMVPTVCHVRGVPNASIVVNKTTGAVTITEGTDFPAPSNGGPIHARYDWNMAAGNNEPRGSRVTARGFNYAHRYDIAGTYTITLKRTDQNGLVSNYRCQITVAPDTRTAIYVASNGDSSSTNNGTNQLAPVNLARAIGIVAANANIKVILRRGDKFTLTGNGFSVTKSNTWITSVPTFFTGTNSSVYPEIMFSGPAGGRNFVLNYANSANTVIENVSINQDYAGSQRGNDKIVRCFGPDNVCVGNINITKCGQGVYLDDSGAARYVFMHNIVSPYDDGMWGYLVYGSSGGSDIVGVDLNFVNSMDAHAARHSNYARVMYAFCSLGNKDLPGELLRTTLDIHFGMYCYVYKCQFPYPNTAGGLFQFGFTGTDSYNGTYCKYTVVEFCTIGSQMSLYGNVAEFMFRNNVQTIITQTCVVIDGTTIGLDKLGHAWTVQSSNIYLYNNVHTNQGTTTGGLVKVTRNFTGLTIRNNIYIAPNLKSGSRAFDAQSGVATSYDISRNIWPTSVQSSFKYLTGTYTCAQFNLLGIGDTNNVDSVTIDAVYKATFGVPANSGTGRPVKGVWDSINNNGPGIVSRSQGAASWKPGVYE
jgi:fibronectin type 3 domain-containing protein